MRIVFMGTPEFAVPSLRRMVAAEDGFDVVLVVTGQDKPRRKQHDKPESSPVKKAALELGLNVYETDDPSSTAFSDAVAAAMPEVIVVAAFRILPPEVYNLASSGAFNLHASLLPAYRGAAPVNWAIIRGETVTGITTFFLQERVDTGSIILTREVPLLPEDNATTLAGRLSEEGASLVVDTLRAIASGSVRLRQQDDRLASKAPKLTRENTRIRWDSPSSDLCNFIRGLAMKPAAWTTFNGKNMKVFRAAHAGDNQAGGGEPGTVLIYDGRLLVSAGDGWIEILQLQLEGKKIMDASEFLRGFRQNEYPQPLVLV
ncbi:MAG: methionyl-tRNA formyltransferase [Chlorobi bacterium]|nr:methionyl-tRNA formyltransferase [Chlorobiota bacterium]